MSKLVIVVILLGLAGLIAYIRFAPSDPVAWNIDPMTAPAPNGNGWLLRPEGGNAASPVFATDAAAILTAVDTVAMATPRTTRLVGTPQDGQITYVTRSKLMGYPDYTTISTTPVDGGTALVIYARQRFGMADIGVNQARVEAWVAQLDLPKP